MKKLSLKRRTFGAGVTLTREQLKNVMGGDRATSPGGNPNCGDTNPSGDYYCCVRAGEGSQGAWHIGNTDCQNASSQCNGGMITTDSSRC